MHQLSTLENPVETAAELLFFRLREILEMEKQLGESLPTFSAIIRDSELRELISEQIRLTVQRRAELAALLAEYEISPGESGDDSVQAIISGANMQLADIEDQSMRDLLVAAHFLRIGHDCTAVYQKAASLARIAGYVAEWALLANSYAEQEIAVATLDRIGARLFENQMHPSGRDLKVA